MTTTTYHYIRAGGSRRLRATICVMIDGVLATAGVAWCSDADQPVKEIGRRIAHGRALRGDCPWSSTSLDTGERLKKALDALCSLSTPVSDEDARCDFLSFCEMAGIQRVRYRGRNKPALFG